jgi:hypothetical protein
VTHMCSMRCTRCVGGVKGDGSVRGQRQSLDTDAWCAMRRLSYDDLTGALVQSIEDVDMGLVSPEDNPDEWDTPEGFGQHLDH